MTVHIVEETAHMLAQGIIQNQQRVSLCTAHRFRLLEQIRDTTVVDAVLEPRCFGEKAGEIGFVRTLEDTAGDVRQTFVVQDHQARQVMLEMAKLATILEEITKDFRVGSHDGSGGYDGKLHKAFALSPRGELRALEYHIDQKWQNTTVEYEYPLYIGLSSAAGAALGSSVWLWCKRCATLGEGRPLHTCAGIRHDFCGM